MSWLVPNSRKRHLELTLSSESAQHRKVTFKLSFKKHTIGKYVKRPQENHRVDHLSSFPLLWVAVRLLTLTSDEKSVGATQSDIHVCHACLEKVELLGLSTTKNDGFPIQKTVNRIVKGPSINEKSSWLMKCRASQLPFLTKAIC